MLTEFGSGKCMTKQSINALGTELVLKRDCTKKYKYTPATTPASLFWTKNMEYFAPQIRNIQTTHGHNVMLR